MHSPEMSSKRNFCSDSFMYGVKVACHLCVLVCSLLSLADRCTGDTFQRFSIALNTLDDTSPHCHSFGERTLHDVVLPRNNISAAECWAILIGILHYICHMCIGTHNRSPYCRLGIVNQKHIESSSEFKFLSEWQKAGAVAEVASTTTKPATVEPVWNEDVKL